MKRLLLVIIAMMSLLPAFAGEKAKMTLVTKVHDFGYVKEKGGDVTCWFEFRNTGDEPYNPHGALFVRLHKARLSKEAHCPRRDSQNRSDV